jgi:hypothetical protein
MEIAITSRVLQEGCNGCTLVRERGIPENSYKHLSLLQSLYPNSLRPKPLERLAFGLL